MNVRGAFLVLAMLFCAAGAGAAAAEEAAKEQAAKLPPFRAIDYPIEIRKALSYGPDECKRQGGSKATFAPDTVRKVDLTGDGIDDYIISYRDTQCAGREAVYCGTAGCTFEIHVTMPNGKQRMVSSTACGAMKFFPARARAPCASAWTAPTAALPSWTRA